MLVGLHGAHAPQWHPKSGPGRGGLRSDVYRAFTRVVPEPFVYLPHADKFVTANMAEGESIKVLAVSLDSLIADRRAFVEKLPPDEQKPFLAALDQSANPLTNFRNVAVAQGKINQWIAVQAEQIRSRVIRWATDNQITPRDAWFRNPRTGAIPHRTLYRLVPYLTADEIRDLRIPFRAVEAFLAAFSPHRSVKDTWKRVHAVHSRHDSIEAVEKSISRFSQHHRADGAWCDSRELAFSHDGYHGHHDLPAWRRRKLTFRFPDGFHFDVKHIRGRDFHLHDQEGKPKHFVRYTNVDPHGFLRGGS